MIIIETLFETKTKMFCVDDQMKWKWHRIYWIVKKKFECLNILFFYIHHFDVKKEKKNASNMNEYIEKLVRYLSAWNDKSKTWKQNHIWI